MWLLLQVSEQCKQHKMYIHIYIQLVSVSWYVFNEHQYFTLILVPLPDTDIGIDKSTFIITARMVTFSLWIHPGFNEWILSSAIFRTLSSHEHHLQRVWIGCKGKLAALPSITSALCSSFMCFWPWSVAASVQLLPLLLPLPHSFPSVNYSYHKQHNHLCNSKQHLVLLQMSSGCSLVVSSGQIQMLLINVSDGSEENIAQCLCCSVQLQQDIFSLDLNSTQNEEFMTPQVTCWSPRLRLNKT